MPEHVSILLPNVITLVWRLVSLRADTAGAQFPYSAKPSPSRSVPPISVSQGTCDSCSCPSHRSIPSGELCSTSQEYPVPGGIAVGPSTVGGRAGVGALL